MRTALSGLILRLATASAAPAPAQAADDSNPERPAALGEIVVTAEKKSERLQEVPVPVTVISADLLDERNQTRMQDYFVTVPGLTLNSSGNGQASLAIRGVTTGSLTTPTVGITIDDIPYGSSTALGYGARLFPDIDPSDLSQIEVLRGPQGALYGASSIGGLLKIVTVDPSTTGFSGRVEADGSATSGGGNGYGVRGAVNVPVSETLALRASAFTRHDPGYIDNPAQGREDLNGGTTKGGRLAALWNPSDRFSLKLTAMLQDADIGGTSEVDANYLLQPTQGDLDQNRLRGTGRIKTKVQLYGAIATAEVGSATLTSVSGYGVNTYNGTLDVSLGYANPARRFFDVSGAALTNSFETRKFSQEVRLASASDQKIEWLLGGFYTHEDTPAHQRIVAVDPETGASPGLLLDSPFPTTFAEYAVFGELTAHFTPRFDIQVGARESRNEQSYSETDTGPVVGGIFVNPSAHTQANAFTYLITPRFKVSRDLMIYSRIASGYRAGGPNPDASLYGLPLAYKPDKTVNYEIGAKGQLLDGALSFDASLYYIDWKDIQIQLRDPTSGLAYFTNGGKARSQGAELSLQSRPSEGLTIRANASVGAAKLTQDMPKGAGIGFSGDRLPYSSKFSGSLSIDQDIPLNGMSAFVGATASYVGDRYADFAPAARFYRTRLPSYTSFDLRSGLTWDTWRWTLFVKNLTDERGLIGGGPRRAGGGAIGDPFYVNYVQPRTIGLSVSKVF